jgi:hypothetical protein
MMTNKIKREKKRTEVDTIEIFFFLLLIDFYFKVILLPVIVMSEKKIIGYQCCIYL